MGIDAHHFAHLCCSHTCLGVFYQPDDGLFEIPVTREADIVVSPNTEPIKARDIRQYVVLPIVVVAAEAAPLSKVPLYRSLRATQTLH
jgi:hypothetical protein